MSLIEHLESEIGKKFSAGTLNIHWMFEKQSIPNSLQLSGRSEKLAAAGGVSRVREHLNDQMEMRRFPATKKAAVNDFLDELVRENRARLLDLMAQEVLAPRSRSSSRLAASWSHSLRICGTASWQGKGHSKTGCSVRPCTDGFGTTNAGRKMKGAKKRSKLASGTPALPRGGDAWRRL